MSQEPKTLIVMPKESVDEMLSLIRKNSRDLEDLKANKEPAYVTRAEFMQITKISATKFASVVKHLQHTRQGKTLYLPYTEVTRYLRGEVTIPTR